MLTPQTLLALLGIAVTIVIFLSGVVYGMGGLNQRVKALEDWRGNMRVDMHEVSDIMARIERDVAVLRAREQKEDEDEDRAERRRR